MAYIGTPVQQALTKVTSQSFNGTGSQTVFTLNRAVNTGEELEVFVNNVQQEPGVGKSYTATGTTLTFDAAPSSGTGNIYVIYRGLAEVTRRLEHDPNAALAATTGTFNRKTSDGDIVEFRKDGTTVGSIGSVIGARLRVDSNSVAGYLGIAGTDRYYWNNTELGVTSDNAYNLGASGARFKDLYLSGGVYLGGTAAANALDDYEEGTWTPTYVGASGSLTVSSYLSQSGSYTKVGRLVYIQGILRTGGISGVTSGTYDIGGLPFNVAPAINNAGTPTSSSVIVCSLQSNFINAPQHFTTNVNTTTMRARQGTNVGDTGYTNGNTTDLNTAADKNRVSFAGCYETDE